MHPNPIYRTADSARNIAFARERGFGALAMNGAAGPLVAHIPFLLDAGGHHADLHLVRSNPIARALSVPQPVVIAVGGPDSYISPDWYGVADQVPTWNYIAVHLRGTLELLPSEDLRDIIDSESAYFESALLPKPPWVSTKTTPDVLERMMRQIVPCRLNVTAIDGTWKLGQNKSDDVRMRAADAAEDAQQGGDATKLAMMMRQPPMQSKG